MKAIVTGATGYIGSHLVKHLLNNEWEVCAIVRPSSRIDELEALGVRLYVYTDDISSLVNYFKEEQPAVVFHVAAAVITNAHDDQVQPLIDANIKFGTVLLEAMKQSGTRLFVNTGTYWQNCNTDAYSPVDLYAATKEAFEKIISYYTDCGYIRCVTLRLYDVYGEDDTRPKLLNLLCSIAGTDKSIDISPAEQQLDLVHVSDVCTAYLAAYQQLATDSTLSYRIYGVTSGHRYKLRSVIEMLQAATNKPIKVNIGGKPYKNREIMEPTKAYDTLPDWRCQTSMQEGLKKLVNSRTRSNEAL